MCTLKKKKKRIWPWPTLSVVNKVLVYGTIWNLSKVSSHFNLSRPQRNPPPPPPHTTLSLSLFLSQFWSFKQKTRDPLDLIIFGVNGRTVSCALEAMLSMIFRSKNNQQETVNIDLNFKVKTWSQRVFNANRLLGCHIKHTKIED